MFNFRKSVINLVAILTLIGSIAVLLPFIGRGQGNSPTVMPQLAPRRFYLTQTEQYMGNQALSACAAGYHMASLVTGRWLDSPTFGRPLR